MVEAAASSGGPRRDGRRMSGCAAKYSGFFFAPTILTASRRTPSSRAKEVFVRCSPCCPSTPRTKRVAIANATPYGLAGAV